MDFNEEEVKALCKQSLKNNPNLAEARVYVNTKMKIQITRSTFYRRFGHLVKSEYKEIKNEGYLRMILSKKEFLNRNREKGYKTIRQVLLDQYGVKAPYAVINKVWSEILPHRRHKFKNRRKKLKRTTYRSYGPEDTEHIDGNDKLGIDWMGIFLHASARA
eukprot:Nk52_evm33s163 gene=Nk52_evmTU33s163